MPVDWNSDPPTLQVDRNSIQDYRQAAEGQRFFGVVDLIGRTIYIVPSAPIKQKKGGWFGTVEPSFTRALVARDDSPLPPSHVMTIGLLQIPASRIARHDLAGFSATKVDDVNISISFRSGLNVSFENGPTHFGEDDGRMMPPQWTIAIQETFELALGGSQVRS